MIRHEFPAIQRGVFQGLPVLKHLAARLELQHVRVTAADGPDLLLQFAGLIPQHARGAKINDHADRIQNARGHQRPQPYSPRRRFDVDR